MIFNWYTTDYLKYAIPDYLTRGTNFLCQIKNDNSQQNNYPVWVNQNYTHFVVRSAKTTFFDVLQNFFYLFYFFKILICYCYSITVVCLFSPFHHPQNFFLKILFYFRGEGREKERERNINVWFLSLGPPLGTWPEIQACALTGNRTSDPLAHSSCSIHWAISPSAAEF